MSREHRKKWMNRVLSLLLIAVMLLEPSTVSRAAEVPGLTGEGETVLETGQTTDPEEVLEPSDSEKDSETSNPEEDADAGEPEQGEEPEEDPEPAQPGASEDGVSGNDIGDETEENGTEESTEDLQAQEADRTANAAEDFEISGTTLVRYNGTDSKVVIPDGIVMIDVDHFKAINDTYGHPVGDIALKKIASAILSCIRSTDMLIRYGGDEFLVIFPQIQKEAFALKMRYMQDAVSRAAVDGYPDIRLSISIGGVYRVDPLMEAIRQADQLMYRDKAHKGVLRL